MVWRFPAFATMTRPPPLTPPDCDLRDFGFMPLDVVRFAQSDLVAFAPPEAVVAAILLWGASWHARPAGSLTNDDRALANLAGYGRAVDAWKAIKDEAMRGFVLCSDDRWYHPVVCEKVRTSWEGKLKQRWRTYCAAIRQHNGRYEDDQRKAPTYEAWLDGGQPTTIRATPKAPEQGNLGYEDPHNVTRDIDSESRVTEGGSHARVTLQNPSKGQYKGQYKGEGEGERDSSLSTTAPDIWSGDLLETANALAKLAGISLHKETNRIAAIDMVKAWRSDDIDVATVIVPIIERDRRDNPDATRWSLVFFDPAVRSSIARVKSKPTARKAPRHLAAKDQDDDRVRAIRAELDTIRGCEPDRIALAMNGVGLIITARDERIAAEMERPTTMRWLKRAAHKATGSDVVTVRTQ